MDDIVDDSIKKNPPVVATITNCDFFNIIKNNIDIIGLNAINPHPIINNTVVTIIV